MDTRFAATLLMFAVFAIGSGAGPLAHEGHAHKVMGTVTMAAADHVMLEDTNGKKVSIKITKETKVKATPPIKVEDIKPGTRVVVTAVEEKGTGMRATIIQLGSTAAAK